MQASQDPTPASRLHDLLRPEVLAAFDRTFFEREGYWVWEGILTDAGQQRWTASSAKTTADERRHCSRYRLGRH